MVLQIHYHPHGTSIPDTTAVDLMTETSVPHPSLLYLMADTNLYLPPMQANASVGSEVQLPGFLGQYNVWGVFPHMHTLGQTLSFSLSPLNDDNPKDASPKRQMAKNHGRP